MPIGRLVRFNSEKKYGFVRPDSESGPDVFIHCSILQRGGFKSPKVGEPIVFEVGERAGKECVVSCEPLRAWQIEDDDED
jgi:cold shock CspA family protein